MRRSMRASQKAAGAMSCAEGLEGGGGAVRGEVQRMLLEELLAEQVAGGTCHVQRVRGKRRRSFPGIQTQPEGQEQLPPVCNPTSSRPVCPASLPQSILRG